MEAVRLRNRLHAALDLGWPEFGGQFSELDKVTPLALLERWPTATDLAQAAPRAVHALVKRASRNHISPERIRALITSAHETVALQEGTAARRAEIERLLHRWALVREHIATVEARLEELVAAHPAARALATVPEVGVVCAATLVAELGDPAWYEAPRQMVKLAGMTLADRTSGSSVRGRAHQTKHGRPLLRRQLFLLASRWCSGRGLYRQEYLALRRGGKPTTVAICAIARKLVPLVFMVMRTEQPFDLARWQRNRLGATRAGRTPTSTPYRRG